MGIPKNKSELLKAIREDYQKLSIELATIPLELTEIKELEGHAKNTLMSINDLLAYLIGWGELVLKWNNKKDKGLEVDFPETGFKWNELGLLAQKFYKDFRHLNFNMLKDRLHVTTQQILELIEGKTDSELYETSWYGKWTLGRMIQFNTSSPFKNAKGRIKKWKKGR